MIVAVVPARGGSKRLADKNILPFCGRPLFAWSVETAQRAAGVAACFVSTDSERIAELAYEAGAEVICRPADFATDTTPTVDVLHHAILELEKRGVRPSGILTLQPTSPLRPASMVDDAVALFKDDVSAVVSVSAASAKLGHVRDGCFEPDYRPGTRSQDMAPFYREDGLLYLSRATQIRDQRDMFGSSIAALITPKPYGVVDIDDKTDFKLAEALANALIR